MPSFHNFEVVIEIENAENRAVILSLLFADQAFKCEPPKFEQSGAGVEIKTSFAASMAYLEYSGKKRPVRL